MRIPFDQLDGWPREGLEFRVNFYRIQGRPREEGRLNTRIVVSWAPTYKANNHVPESFGRLRAGRTMTVGRTMTAGLGRRVRRTGAAGMLEPRECWSCGNAGRAGATSEACRSLLPAALL
jgi:hypothetical protein